MSIFHFPLLILHLLGLAAIALVCVLLAWPHLVVIWPSIRDEIDRFRRQPPLAKVVLLVFIAGFIAYGSTKTNQVDQVKDEGEGEQWMSPSFSKPKAQDDKFHCSLSPVTFTSNPPTVTPENIARGWQLWEVRTNCNVSYAMPENATLATNWWVRGAYEDIGRLDFGEWRFPFGTNEYSSLWAFSWGKARFALADTNTEIVAVGAPMSAVPYRSRLWTAVDTNGTRFVTWENFAFNRDTNTPVNAQIELRANGDFITRSNGVETVYRRLDPEDWDGDGWRNEDDWDPCGWEEFYDMFCPELPEGADESAYYWIDIRPRWNSDICFYGDAPSNLEDPYVYGRAGETYRVRLLIGKTYDVESTQPLDIVAKSDDRIEVANVAPNSFTAVWPVGFTVAEGRAPTGRPRLGATWNDGGRSFHVLPDPPWLHGEITWTNEFCCEVWGDGTNFTYACDNTCTCEGCTVYGNYWYEGYRLPVWGIPCGCHYVEDRGGASVEISFDRSVAAFEGVYTNAPGDVVNPIPSNVVLTCHAYGGTYGGQLDINIKTHGRITRVGGDTLPLNESLLPGEERTYEVIYRPVVTIEQGGDVVAAASFVENFTGNPSSGTAELTVVRVWVEAEADWPENKGRHVFGPGEIATIQQSPSEPQLHFAKFLTDDGVVYEQGRLIAPRFPGSFTAEGVAGGDEALISMQFSVIAPQSLRGENAHVMTADEWDVRQREGSIEEDDSYPLEDSGPGVVMYCDVYVEPSFVSFTHINIFEWLALPTNRQGCYENTFSYPDSLLDHDFSNGAVSNYLERANQVSGRNYVGADTPGVWFSEQTWYASGSYDLPIPTYWYCKPSPEKDFQPQPRLMTTVVQHMSIDTNGTMRVEKFGVGAERSITNNQ